MLIGLGSNASKNKNKNDYTELNGPGNAKKISKREKTRPERLQTAIVRRRGRSWSIADDHERSWAITNDRSRTPGVRIEKLMSQRVGKVVVSCFGHPNEKKRRAQARKTMIVRGRPRSSTSGRS